AANVANFDRRAIDVRHDQFFHVARVGVAAQRAQDEFAPAGFDIAAGHVRVLALQSIAYRRNRNLVTRQPLGVDPDINRAIETAHDIDCANATGALELYFDDLVGVLSQLANRTLTGKCDRQYRRAVVIELYNDGWFRVGRQIAHDRADAIANVLRGRVDVAIQIEGGDDDRVALHRNRAQVVDAVDGVDDFLDALRDQRLHLFRRRPGQIRAHRDGGKIYRRKAIDAQLEIARRPDYDQRQNDHRGKDRAADTDFSELLHCSVFLCVLCGELRIGISTTAGTE